MTSRMIGAKLQMTTRKTRGMLKVMTIQKKSRKVCSSKRTHVCVCGCICVVSMRQIVIKLCTSG